MPLPGLAAGHRGDEASGATGEFCAQCGRRMSVGDKFCGACGRPRSVPAHAHKARRRTKFLVAGGAALLLVVAAMVGNNPEHRPRGPTGPSPSGAPQVAPQAATGCNDASLLRFDVEVRAHLITMRRLLQQANRIVDEADAALDSGNCGEVGLVGYTVAARAKRIDDQITKESAWFSNARGDPRTLELARCGMGRGLMREALQVAARDAAFRARASDAARRVEAAEAACAPAR